MGVNGSNEQWVNGVVKVVNVAEVVMKGTGPARERGWRPAEHTLGYIGPPVSIGNRCNT